MENKVLVGGFNYPVTICVSLHALKRPGILHIFFKFFNFQYHYFYFGCTILIGVGLFVYLTNTFLIYFNEEIMFLTLHASIRIQVHFLAEWIMNN